MTYKVESFEGDAIRVTYAEPGSSLALHLSAELGRTWTVEQYPPHHLRGTSIIPEHNLRNRIDNGLLDDMIRVAEEAWQQNGTDLQHLRVRYT